MKHIHHNIVNRSYSRSNDDSHISRHSRNDDDHDSHRFLMVLAGVHDGQKALP